MSWSYKPTNLRRSVRQELRVARDTLGRRVAGSGAMPGNKGDVRSGGGNFLIEAKTTTRASFGLSLKLWRKIEHEARQKALEPAMVIDISGRRLAVIDYDLFTALSILWLGDPKE